MFIQIEKTPNPLALKFLPGCVILKKGFIEFNDINQAKLKSNLAFNLLSIKEIETVLLGYDFITIKKKDDKINWKYLQTIIIGTITDYILSGNNIINNKEHNNDNYKEKEFFDIKDMLIVNTIKNIIQKRIQPAVKKDGGYILFRGFKNGIVYLTMRGSCSGCPSASQTLKIGIENMLCHFINEVKSVEEIF